MTTSTVVIGQIHGLHGVQGAVKLLSFCEPRERLGRYQPWTLVLPDGSHRELRHGKLGMAGKALVCTLDGVTDRDQAALLIGAEIRVARDTLPKLPDGEYYWSDLIGLTVRNLDGVELGRITEMLRTGANDVMQVEGDRIRLLPYVPGQWVKAIDLATGVMTVDWDPDF